MSHLTDALILAKVIWTDSCELKTFLDQLAGDVVQVCQAVKEQQPTSTSQLEKVLSRLLSSILEIRTYSQSHQPEPLVYPFQRAERQLRDTLAICFGKAPIEVAGSRSSEGTLLLRYPNAKAIQTFKLDETMLR